MTDVEVIDASAVAAVLFGEPGADLAAAQVTAPRLVAPTLLMFEVANVCLKKLRRLPEQRAALLAAWGRLPRLDIALMEVDHPAALLLAEATRLSAYDASYLWLARHLGSRLVTLDARLRAAADAATA